MLSGIKWRVKIADSVVILSNKAFLELRADLDDKSTDVVDLEGILFKKNQFRYAEEMKDVKVLSEDDKDRMHKKVMIYDEQGKTVSLYDFERRQREEELEYARPIIKDIQDGKELTTKEFREQVIQRYAPYKPENTLAQLTDTQKSELNAIYRKIVEIRESKIDTRMKITKEFYWRGRVRKLFQPVIQKNSEKLESVMRELSLID